MTEELREHMESLRKTSPGLNSKVQDAEKIVTQLDDFLRGIGAGVSASAAPANFKSCYGEPDEDGTGRWETWTLAYGRLRGSFCIHVECETHSVDGDGDLGQSLSVQKSAWANLSRGDKLKSVTTLTNLMRNIDEAAIEQDQEAGAALDEIRETMTTLGIEPTAITASADGAGDAKPARKPRP